MSDKPITAEGIVDEQANDPGLWFVAQTAPEAYLQVALRRLHAAVEDVARIEAIEAERDAALREVEEHKSRCTVLEAEVAEWKSQFAAALARAIRAEKGKP